MSSPRSTRSPITSCGDCHTEIEQQRRGRPRQVCDDCRERRKQEYERWGRVRDPEMHRRHNRDSARRRRAAGRTT